MMSPPKHRLVSMVLGSVVALFGLDAIEQYRALQSPAGWHRTDANPLQREGQSWKIGNSAWRLGSRTAWMSEQSHQQAYIRPKLHPNSRIGMSLSNHQSEPLWIWLNAAGGVSAVHKDAPISCMGKIPASTDIKAIELNTHTDGLLVTRGDFKMICPRDEADEQPVRLLAMDGEVQLLSVGRDRQTDGVPLSPLWWMSGLMGLVFLWMIMFDVLMGTARRIFRMRQPLNSPREE